MEAIIEELEEEYHKSESYEIGLQILTLSPFTKRNYEVFWCHQIYGGQSKKIEKYNGNLTICAKYHMGKIVSRDDIVTVTQFYECDDVSSP